MSNLARIRKSQGLSRYRLAQMVNMKPQALEYLEKTKGAIPRLPNARLIAKALGVKVDSLWPVEEVSK